MKNTKKAAGFTIVELVVVIAVIGILAAITIVAYTGTQEKARDTARISNVDSIRKALEVYKLRNGSYPMHQSASGAWETTTNYPTSFINALKTSGIMSSVPIDPINAGTKYYRYYQYPPGSSGCDAARGSFYVIMIMDLESKNDKGHGPGWKCPSRDWSLEGDWAAGSFTF